MSSFSKGCFVEKPSQSSSKSSNSLLDPTSYLSSKSDNSLQRWNASQDIWQNIQRIILKLDESLQSSLLNDIVEFVKNSYLKKSFHNDGVRTEIPTAALLFGVNMPDHMQLFTTIQHRLKDSVTSHVALLQSKNCTNVKNLMRALGEQLILESNDSTVNDHENSLTEESILNNGSAFVWKRNIPLTLSMLEKWYLQANHTVLSLSPTKKRKTESKNPVVIIFYDTEAFKPSVIQDVIAMLSSIVPKVPLVFLFGVATSWSAVVDRQLPHSAIVHLALEKFHAVTSSDHLTMIIDEIVLTNEVSFMMTGKCLQILLDVFLYHDFSTQNFLNTFKFCILEHFYQRPESILCVPSIKGIDQKVKNLTSKDLQHFRKLPSVVQYNTTVTSSNLKKLQNDDVHFKSSMVNWLFHLNEFHLVYFPALRCLHAMTTSLPRHPLGKQIRELYFTCSNSVITEHESYKECQLYWKVSSREQLESYVVNCVDILSCFQTKSKKNFAPDHTFEQIEMLETTLKQLKEIKRKLKNINNGNEEATSDEEETKEKTDAEEDVPMEKVKYAYQLKEKLRSRVQKKNIKKMTKFEKVRLEFIEVMDKFYESTLLKIECFPLYEVFYYNYVNPLRNQVIASPRLSIQKALSTPASYLQAACLTSDFPGAIPKHSPDICVAYKLHNECGRIINIYDWLNAFHTIVCCDEVDEEDDEVINIDEITHARFIRTASELQMLGFIAATKRKADHVKRLTWACF